VLTVAVVSHLCVDYRALLGSTLATDQLASISNAIRCLISCCGIDSRSCKQLAFGKLQFSFWSPNFSKTGIAAERLGKHYASVALIVVVALDVSYYGLLKS